ncbi:hypothetical protein ACTWPB_17000 [Nocardia sp. IBHARD005]|uniref:hypothetical protein n=1 Tax=Nocardia sp. IBHARD005 TaxID=3457765 RepID=UPI004057F666
MTHKTFRAVYEIAGVYDKLLLRHYYGGTEDVDLVADWLTEHHRATDCLIGCRRVRLWHRQDH